MKLPSLNELATSRENVDVFAGYNHNLRISENEFYDMENLTSANYPVISPRGKRGTYATVSNPQGMVAKDALCYVDGEYFVINQNRINLGLSTKEEDCPKRLISMGAYVIILPKCSPDGVLYNHDDAKWINTANLTEYGSINAHYTNIGSVKFTMCGADGEAYKPDYIQPNEPEKKDANGNKVDMDGGAIWLDTSSTTHSLKVYSSSSGMWTSIATTYIKITADGIAKDFNQYDGVTISGLKGKVLTESGTGGDIDPEYAKQLAEIDGSFVIWDKDTENNNWILIVGLLDKEVELIDPITIKREMPIMDYVVESENRLWGCRYGMDRNGNVVNEIYASKLGDFKNWNCYMNVSTDSYTASCGTDGQFTGAITHLGYPIFFKEGFMHKVYGNYPANYQIQTTACRGVQKGSEKSLAIVNEILYYKSRNAVCAYDGSLPVEMSSALGDMHYSCAVACGHGNKYYISMKDGNGKYHLFVYDTAKGMWHREDNLQVDFFCPCDDEVYYVDHNNRSVIKTLLGSGDKDKDSIKWMAESGVIGCSSPDKKYVSRLTVRMSLNIGTIVRFFVQYDSCGEWEHLFTMQGTNLSSFSVPVRPKRCDHFRFRIEGEGDAKIYSITKVLEQGSDI